MKERATEILEPVVKKILVPLSQEAAFRLFTEGMGRWWPMLTHSVGEADAETCYFKGREGGLIYEVMKDGNQVEWGKVLSWEPFERTAFHWYPGRGPETAQVVTVTFHEAPGGTMVELVHTGWESLGEQAFLRREGYVTGWETVLGKYSEIAGALPI